jgi:hypothetical protein
LLQKCKDPEASAVDTFARTEPPDTQVSDKSHLFNTLDTVEYLTMLKVVRQNTKFIQMKTTNLQFHKQEGLCMSVVTVVPTMLYTWSCNAALIPGFLEGRNFVVCVEAI